MIVAGKTLADLRAEGSHPRIHPNGFIQLDVVPGDENQRIHIWHRDIPRQKVYTPIHDHAFDMVSTCVRGYLRDLCYRLEIDGVDDHEWGPYDVWQVGDRPGMSTILAPTGEWGFLRIVRRMEVREGYKYDIPAFEFHESVPIQFPTVTIMTKTHRYDGIEPRILVPSGLVPDNTFRKDAHRDDMLWEIAEEAMS